MIWTHRAPRVRESRAGDGAAQVVVGVAVAAGKLWAGEPENLVDLRGSPSLRQQVPGDPPIDDAPVGLRKALADAPAFHTTLIDVAGYRHGDRGRVLGCRGGAGSLGWMRRRQGPGRQQQCFGSRCQTRRDVDDFHPGGVAGGCAARGLLIGEAGEPSQVTPVGAGAIASISQRQQPAGSGRHRRFQGCGAEVNPGLQMAGAGLQYHTGVMPMGAHGGDRRRRRTIQVDQNVACVLVAGVGLHIDVASFTVAHAQKPDGGRVPQLLRGPQPFTWKRSPSRMMNQTDQVQLLGHGRELPANGLQGDKKSAVVHDRNSVVVTNRRTMDFQRTASCVLTVCLSRGGRRSVGDLSLAAHRCRFPLGRLGCL